MSKEQFEKWALTNGIDISRSVPGDIYYSVRARGAYEGYESRQPEIDAKDKTIDDLALQKAILLSSVGSMGDEIATLKAEVEQINKAASDAVLILRCLSVDPVLTDSWQEKADRAANGLVAAMKETK